MTMFGVFFAKTMVAKKIKRKFEISTFMSVFVDVNDNDQVKLYLSWK